MAKGDHIVVRFSCYTHHGIDMGDGTVVEYGGDHFDFRKNVIQRVSLEKFLQGGELQVRAYEGEINSPEIVVARAESRLGETDYSLWANNCEHFASWCKVSKHASDQVSWYEGLGWMCGGLMLAAGSAAVLVAAAVGSLQGQKKSQYEAPAAQDS